MKISTEEVFARVKVISSAIGVFLVSSLSIVIPSTRVYYSVAVWRFKPILRFHSHLSGGLRSRNYRAVAGNHKFSSRFSVFACFYGGYSNRVKRLRRLSGKGNVNFTSLFCP